MASSNAHLLPFMHVNNDDELGSLYNSVLKAMKEIAIGIPDAVNGLVSIAEQWYAKVEFLILCIITVTMNVFQLSSASYC